MQLQLTTHSSPQQIHKMIITGTGRAGTTLHVPALPQNHQRPAVSLSETGPS